MMAVFFFLPHVRHVHSHYISRYKYNYGLATHAVKPPNISAHDRKIKRVFNFMRNPKLVQILVSER